MPSPRKNRTPPIAANISKTVRPLAEQPPALPHGVAFEYWGGALAIDHALQLWEVPPRALCLASLADLTPKQRKVIGDYMIALWTAFRDHPGEPHPGEAAASESGPSMLASAAPRHTRVRTVRKSVPRG